MNPFDQNQPTAQPNYSPDAEIARNEVWQALPPSIPDLGFMRDHPNPNEITQHQNISGQFAPAGQGTQYMGIDTNRLVVSAWTPRGIQAWALSMAPAKWPFDISKLLKDLVLGNSTGDLPYLTYGFWEGILNASPDVVTLRDAARATSVWFHAADMFAVMIAGGKAYENIVAAIKAELAKSA